MCYTTNMQISEPYSKRLRRLRQEMKKADLSAFWVARPENRQYLSGYTATDPQLNETSGSLFITPRNQYLLTDSRYEIQAAREAKGYQVWLIPYLCSSSVISLLIQYPPELVVVGALPDRTVGCVDDEYRAAQMVGDDAVNFQRAVEL